ncbi:MAG TPA: hypothetical protein VIM57_09980 [Luteolibacter sp.]
MSDSIQKKRFVVARLHWFVANPTESPTAGITAYREWLGPEDLFSVFVRFSSPDEQRNQWQEAKIYALVDEMESRLPFPGAKLVLTAGANPVAEAEVLAEGEE